MKKIIVFLVLLAFSCETTNLEPLPVSMKGYELYSWENKGQWNFTLMTGTNRNKTYEEIVALENIEANGFIKITTFQMRDLKGLLTRIPPGESVSWINSSIFVAGFSLPPASIIQEIEKHCRTLNLDLYIIN